MNVVKREARYASVGFLLGSGYLWLARDLNGSIAAYSDKPLKLDDERWWVEDGESKEMWMWVDDGELYNFVKWEDEEPVNIREWLEKEEEEMKMYSVKDGELECREVDADFFEKNTTLGGLLTPRELDRDNNIVTEGVTMVNMNSRNSGKSAILEKAKEIREALEALEVETKSSSGWELGMKRLGEAIASPSYEPPVSIVADQFEYRHEHLDVASMYPGDTISEKATTLGGLLAPNEVELDRDNRKESPFLRSLHLTSNMMETEAANVSLIDLNANSITTGTLNGSNMCLNPLTCTMQLTLDNVQIHAKVCQELTETYKKKNADYGNSFENSLDKHGMIAGIVRMDDKMSRLISLNSKNEQLVLDESMRDTLMDLANYAIMSVMWLDEQ